jgi:hypothetical protein
MFARLLRASAGIKKLPAATASKDRIKERAPIFRADFKAMTNLPFDEPRNFIARFYSIQGFDGYSNPLYLIYIFRQIRLFGSL